MRHVTIRRAAMLSVIIPANDEAGYIGRCLAAVLSAEDPGVPVEIIVSANACRDTTAALAQGYEIVARRRGWRLLTIDRAEPGKPGALNAADALATGDARLYLDADVVIEPSMLARLVEALATDTPRYASGRLMIEPAATAFSRWYARLWERMPFVSETVPGCGLFAVNAAGRARWGAFPEVIADDIFARLRFSPSERVTVPAGFLWPVAEGFGALVRVRRRQDAGVAEIGRRFPELLANEDKPRLGLRRLLRLAASDPLGFAAYGAVAVAVRAGGPARGWSRGR
jgi:glycosyltransferase involved in cell wall biosynthesis